MLSLICIVKYSRLDSSSGKYSPGIKNLYVPNCNELKFVFQISRISDQIWDHISELPH